MLSDEKTVSFHCIDGRIYIPKQALKLLNIMKFIPGFGINRNHKCYENNDPLNNKSYIQYCLHVFIAGLNGEQFCNETLPHEVIHLCGSRGGNPFLEGLTELKAREVSIKYDFPLSRCGYSKEVEIVVLVQDILGKDLMDKIAFCPDEIEIKKMIEEKFGENTYDAFMDIRDNMTVMSRYFGSNTAGPFAAVKKAFSYSKVKYDGIIWKIKALEQAAKQDTFITKVNVQEQEINREKNITHTFPGPDIDIAI